MGSEKRNDEKPNIEAILCKIYFDIASSVLGEEEVRKRRDKMIKEL